MRYADRILFEKGSSEFYDPDLGEHVTKPGEVITLPCLIIDLGIEKSIQVFGDYQKDRKVCYLQRTRQIDFTYCTYNNRYYKVIIDKQDGRVLYLEGDNSIG